MTRQEQKTGKVGELFAAQALANLGILQLQRIGTPIKAIATKTPGLFRVIWGEKVLGDYRGILPGGRSVLAEVKTILHHNLQYSDLRPNQPEGLSRHAELGGLSLLTWVHDVDEIWIMEWFYNGIPGFAPRHSITVEMAQAFALLPGTFTHYSP
jgi:hypothetical protein